MPRLERPPARGHDPGGAAPGRHPTVALVTSGGRGVGRLLAVALAEQGVAVGVLARSRTELAETVRLVESKGGTVAMAIADVTDPAALAMAVAGIRARSWGRSICSSTTPAPSARSVRCGRSTWRPGGTRSP